MSGENGSISACGNVGADTLSDLSFALDELIENLKYSAECGERQIELDNETAVALFSPDFVKLPFESPTAHAPQASSAPALSHPGVASAASPTKPASSASSAKAAPSISIGGALPKISGLPTLPTLSSRQNHVQSPRPLSSVGLPSAGKTAGLGALSAQVANCRKCPLFEKRVKVNMGLGNGNSPDVMFIGETPRPDEDDSAVTPTPAMNWGQLLVKMIGAMGYARQDVYITNICKCRPAGNVSPTLDELSACVSFLKEEIAMVRPKTIVALGGSVLSALLGRTDVSSVRGVWQKFEGVDLMPTYHPSYLIRTPAAKKAAWADLQAVVARLGRKIPAPQKR